MIRLLLSGLLCAAPLAAFSQTALVRSGTASAVILIPEAPEAGPGIRFQTSSVEEAAAEFFQTVEAISRAALPVRKVAPGKLSGTLEEVRRDGKNAVVLGSLARELLGGEAKPGPGGFALKAGNGVVAIAGETPRATEIGVHELLEQLGVRWFFPGPLGTVVPRAKDLAVRDQATVQNPSFAARHFGFNANDREPFTAAWKRHQREGGPFLPPAHGIRLGADGSFEKHPEFYSLVNGERTDKQVCLSNPEVLRRAIAETRAFFKENPREPWIGMGPKDGSGFCECAGCRALDSGEWDPFSNDPCVTDRYIWFFNQVLKGIGPEYADKKIAFYIYHTYMRPPVKVKPDPRIVGAFAPIGLCRIHGMNNPVCPEKGYLKGLVTAWKRLLPEVYERGYWFNLADPGMLFIQTHRLRDEIPYYAKEGISGFRTEVTGQWAAQGPSLYIAGKLMWNADADPDALLADYCEKLFGPAGKTMQAYFTLLDGRLRDGDHHTGSAFDLLAFYPAPVRREARTLLARAAGEAGESPYRERLEIFRHGFEHADAFAAMLEAQNRQEWPAAREALAKMDAERESLCAMEPPMLSRQAEGYLRRFFRLPVKQGSARVTGGNRPVAFLKEEWQALLDPQRVGEDLAYYDPRVTGGNWQTAPSWSTTWSGQGLRYYKGLAWYRQSIEVPEKDAAGRLFFWFGGVDESARIWINGKRAGTSAASAFTPFELDVTGLVRPGRNEVVLCVANIHVNELGTGGITAPGFLYAPAEGAQVENLKPLRETFP